MKKFNLDHQYQLYLERVGIKEEDMHPIQKTETKNAFMGACGQMLDICVNEIPDFDDGSAIEVMSYLLHQVQDFWKSRVKNK